jgi:dipeptidyl-peptidase-4
VANDLPDFNGYIAELIPRGYIGIAMDNRGTPVMKGTAWRMGIYKKIGVVNSRDQAMAAKEILKWNFIDTSRVAVHGWSGGGAMTLNLLFRYPEIYKTGVAVSAVTDQRYYDNIYTERYMGLPKDEEEAYKEASPITYAKNLQGHLLYMHGTGDDNVHYKNAENLINELVKQGKTFNLMVYPNRTHGIFEGTGTSQHVAKTILKFIEEYCPPGAR